MRIERFRSVEFGDLPQVAEIMISKFVKQLQKGDGSHLWVNARSGAGGRRNSMPEEIMGLAQRDKIFQILARRFPDFGFVWSDIFGQHGILVDNDSFGAISVQLLNRQKVGQDFRNRPPLGGGLPVQSFRGNVAQEHSQDRRGLLQQRDGWLQQRRGWRKSLHQCPQGGRLIVIPRRPPGKAPARGFNVPGKRQEKSAWPAYQPCFPTFFSSSICRNSP